MSLDACAELVARGDPDRFAATMTAPPALRAKLLPLYAFNLEVARAPWVTQEPMIAEMRIQWWADAVEEIFSGAEVRRHEVVTPLAALVVENGLDREPFDALIEARRLRDARGEQMSGWNDLATYVDATAGGLMALSAQAIGATGDELETARRFGRGSGSANLLTALAVQRANNRMFLPVDRDAAVSGLVEYGLAEIRAARQGAAKPRNLTPVLLCGWQADYILARAKDPKNVWNGDLAPSEFRRRATLSWRAMTGRW